MLINSYFYYFIILPAELFTSFFPQLQVFFLFISFFLYDKFKIFLLNIRFMLSLSLYDLNYFPQKFSTR